MSEGAQANGGATSNGGVAGAPAQGGMSGASGLAGSTGGAMASAGFPGTAGGTGGKGGSAGTGAAGASGAGTAGKSGAGAGGAGAAGQGGASAAGQGGTAAGGSAVGPTCKQAGGNRCATAASDCAGLTTFASSDCAACCLVPQNPVYGSFPDPFVVRVGDTYHAFATGQNIPRITSKDLDTWKAEGKSLNPGPWADQTLDHWAPTAYQAKDKTWVMFYAGVVQGSGQHCLGRATSSSVTGMFVETSNTPFICKSGGLWSLDPSVFQDPTTGKDYLVWRQDTAAMPHGTVHIRELDNTGHLTGTEHQLIERASAEPSWEFDASGGVMENPAMIHAGGTYHLFYSANRWETASYATGHAHCDTPVGPCTKTSTTSPWQGSLGKMLGPGGADFVKAADGTTFMYMHGWESPDVGPGVGARKLWFYRFETPPKIAPL